MKSNKKNIWLWVLTAVMVIASVAFLPSFASILFLVLAVMVAPIDKLQDFLAGYKIKGTIKIVAFVVLFIIACALIPQSPSAPNDTDGSTDPSTSGTTSTTPEETDATKPSETIPPVTEPTETEPSESTQPTEPSSEPTAPTEPIPTETEPTEPPATKPQKEMVWVSSGNGTRYHKYSDCSNMEDPIHMTREEAEEEGYTPCKRCY